MSTGDVLLLVDVIDDFGHEQGEELLASFRERQPALVELLLRVRAAGTPVVYANDNRGVWDGDARRLVDEAVSGPGGDLVREIAPGPNEQFVIKPRYSAFDHTPLDLLLGELECERLLMAGMTTEGCVAQTAIAARERGLKVTVVADACATTSRSLEETALRYIVDVVGARVEEARLEARR